MNHLIHVSSIILKIKNQPSNSTSCSDNALARLLVFVVGKWYWGLQVQWSGILLGIIGWAPSVCNSNRLHVDILRVSFIKVVYILQIPLKWSIILLQSWTSTGYFSNSTSSSVINYRFSPIIAQVTSALFSSWDCITKGCCEGGINLKGQITFEGHGRLRSWNTDRRERCHRARTPRTK